MPALNQRAFRELFDGQREPLFRFLFRLTRNATDAEDLLQETFVTLWRKRDQFEGRGTLEGFARRTAYRLFLNAHAAQARRPSMSGHEGIETVPTRERGVEDDEAVRFLVQRVNEAICTLPDEMREAFVMFRRDGLSCSEIAEVLDAPMKTIESRVRRATQILAQKLETYRQHLPAS